MKKQSITQMILRSLFFVVAFGPGSVWGVDNFHHHIHNFSTNHLNERYHPDYALAQKHALAMGYSMATIGKPSDAKYDPLGVIKLHNAYYAPMRFDIVQKKVAYFNYYSDQNRNSFVRLDRNTYNWQYWDNQDFELLKLYGCAKIDLKNAANNFDSIDEFNQAYWTNWQNGSQTNVVANLQSRWVVGRLVALTLASIYAGNYDALFLDDIGRANGSCANREAGGSGSYATWKDGQKDFMKRLSEQLRKRYTSHGKPYRVFGNIWSPKTTLSAGSVLKWYADKSLRLDHYYYEAGNTLTESQKATGIDPQTGLPAYTSKFGYLPANMISLNTRHGWYGPSYGNPDFFREHLEVMAMAALQGSWFGWYGESNVDRRDANRRLVYTNDLQLLRAIPNWDNLAGQSLGARSYDQVAKCYRSGNSFASPDVVHSRAPGTRELYAVFIKPYSEIKLRSGEKVAAAYFANGAFEKTSENALFCIAQSDLTIRLKCPEKVGRGIRISLK
jgi:hypothetical protein